jgi:hypothetical protein
VRMREFTRQQFTSWMINFAGLLGTTVLTVGAVYAFLGLGFDLLFTLSTAAVVVLLLILTAFTFFYVWGSPNSGLESALILSGLGFLFSLLLLGSTVSPAFTFA